MNCKIFDKHLIDLLDGHQLPEIALHTQQCPQCNEQLQAMKLLVEQIKSIPPIELPPDFEQSLSENLTKTYGRAKRWTSTWWRSHFSAGVLGLLALIIF